MVIVPSKNRDIILSMTTVDEYLRELRIAAEAAARVPLPVINVLPDPVEDCCERMDGVCCEEEVCDDEEIDDFFDCDVCKELPECYMGKPCGYSCIASCKMCHQ